MKTAKVKNDVKCNAEKRHVFGYRGKDGSLCDNLICVEYRDYHEAVEVVKLNCLMAFSRSQMRKLTGVEVVYLGVWNKQENKFDSNEHPDICFTLGEELFKEFDRLNGEK